MFISSWLLRHVCLQVDNLVHDQEAKTCNVLNRCTKSDQRETVLPVIDGDGVYKDSCVQNKTGTKCLKPLATKLLVKHQPIPPAQTSESNEKHQLEDEIKYEQVFTFGDRSYGGLWVPKTGKRLAQGSSKVSRVHVENTSVKYKKIITITACCGNLQGNDTKLDNSDSISSTRHKRIQKYIPQQVYPSAHLRELSVTTDETQPCISYL
jgi:hypothetical protein